MAKPGRRSSGEAGGAQAGSQDCLFGADRASHEPTAAPVEPGVAGRQAGSERSRPRVVVVDGHALAYRSYFGMRELSTSTGIPTHAVYGFVRTILSLLSDSAPDDACVVAFDAPAPTFRHEQFGDYKAGRAPMPDDLPQQLELIKRSLDLLGVARVEVAGLEADDLIGTIARRSEAEGYDVLIVTSDRDALQLVDDAVRVQNPDKALTLGPREVMERYGVRPDQWVDYRALTGDASDNIPGVKGIGPVAARTLLERYGDVDDLLARLDEVEPASQARKLREGLADLELSRSLSRIVTDADIEVTPAAWSKGRAQEEGLKALFRELEFGTFLVELGLDKKTVYEAGSWSSMQAGAPIGYVLSDERATRAELLGLAKASSGRVAACPRTDGAGLVQALRDSGPELNAFDAKALTVVARRHGVNVAPGDDPMLLAYLLDASGSSPEALARRFGAGTWGPDAESRAVVTAELLRLLEPRVQGDQRRVYETIERPLQAVLADMELAGILIDSDLLARQSKALGRRLEDLELRVRGWADDPDFNLNSRDQVARLLFDTLGLRPGGRTATGKRSTAQGALEHLSGEHEAVRVILEHRELAKLKGTYLDPLPTLVDPATGRLHTTFQQAVVATGRLSSVNPNLQNIPVRSELGREIRRAFVADEGNVLVVADYSQIELRVLAHVADEPALKRAFRAGEDIHRRTAAEVFEVPPADVSPDQRRAAKVINFGILYGMGPRSLGRDLGIPVAQAAAYIEAYFERYPKVRAYIDRTLASCRKQGWVETLLGRRRSIPDINSTNRNAREYAERTAYNTPIQGSAADIMKLAMLAMAPLLPEFGGRLLLQVHDEIVAEVPVANADRAAESVKHCMEEAIELAVPLRADLGTGPNWLEAR